MDFVWSYIVPGKLYKGKPSNHVTELIVKGGKKKNKGLDRSPYMIVN